MPRRSNVINSLDWISVGAFLALVIMGWFNIYAAVYDEDHASMFDLSQRYGKQILWIAVTLVIALAILYIDMMFYEYFAIAVFIAVLFVLIMVLLIGHTVNGAKSWFKIGSFLFQPAEFGKFATALAIAKLFSGEHFQIKKISNLMMSFLLISLPAIFILLQPDTGSAMVYSAFILVLYREGMPLWILLLVLILPFLFIATIIYTPVVIIILIWIFGLLYYVYFERLSPYIALVPISLAVSYGMIYLINQLFKFELAAEWMWIYTSALTLLWIAIYAIIKVKNIILITLMLMVVAFGFTRSVDFVFDNVLKEHQQNRINIMLGLEEDPLGVGYNLNQSMIAIGSGGLMGKGFLQGTQTKYNFVPEQSTDFIFCTVGEEWGFLGSFLVLSLFLLLLLRLIVLAERQRWKFARIYGYCVVAILFFHVAINVSMTIGIFPVIGIPLPFFSYGGSSLWAFTILLFIFLNMDARRLDVMH